MKRSIMNLNNKKMKKILCKITSVEPNFEDYGEDFFTDYSMPKVGQNIIVERQEWYPFSVGGLDGESTVPRGGFLKDKNGNICERFLYYTTLEQVSIV